MIELSLLKSPELMQIRLLEAVPFPHAAVHVLQFVHICQLAEKYDQILFNYY